MTVEVKLRMNKRAIAQDMDTLIDELDGLIMYPWEVAGIITGNKTLMRHAWHAYGELLFVGFGMNDGDDGFTVTAEWRKP